MLVSSTESLLNGIQKVYPKIAAIKDPPRDQPILSPSEMFMAATTAPSTHPVRTARTLS